MVLALYSWHIQAVEAQVSLRKCTYSTEPSMLAHIQSQNVGLDEDKDQSLGIKPNYTEGL